jgi:hypothetical protein
MNKEQTIRLIKLFAKYGSDFHLSRYEKISDLAKFSFETIKIIHDLGFTFIPKDLSNLSQEEIKFLIENDYFTKNDPLDNCTDYESMSVENILLLNKHYPNKLKFEFFCKQIKTEEKLLKIARFFTSTEDKCNTKYLLEKKFFKVIDYLWEKGLDLNFFQRFHIENKEDAVKTIKYLLSEKLNLCNLFLDFSLTDEIIQLYYGQNMNISYFTLEDARRIFDNDENRKNISVCYPLLRTNIDLLDYLVERGVKFVSDSCKISIRQKLDFLIIKRDVKQCLLLIEKNNFVRIDYIPFVFDKNMYELYKTIYEGNFYYPEMKTRLLTLLNSTDMY